MTLPLIAISAIAVETPERVSAWKAQKDTLRTAIPLAKIRKRLRRFRGRPRVAALVALSLFPLLAVSGMASSSSSVGTPLAETSASERHEGAMLAQKLIEPSAPGSDQLVIHIGRASRFAWPAFGPITTYFGVGHPTGLDLSLSLEDAPILASAEGVVSFAGGDRCCHYGLFVVVDHADGFSTLYGHLDKISISEGQRVTQGQLLGFGGDTGASTGKHLHFEVMSQGTYLDPLRFLPARQAGPNALPETVNCDAAAIEVDSASRVTLAFATGATAAKIDGASVEPVAAAPPVEASTDEGQVVLGIPLASAATSRTYSYDLAVNLKASGEDRTINCRLALATLPTLPNPPMQQKSLTALAAPTTSAAGAPPIIITPPPPSEATLELQEHFLRAQAALSANAGPAPAAGGPAAPAAPTRAPAGAVAPTSTPAAAPTITPAPAIQATPAPSPSPPAATATPSASPTQPAGTVTP